MTKDEWKDLILKAGQVFTPAAPVDAQQLFAGRIEQLSQAFDVIHQKGQHAIIFGERGVGKTSLANMLGQIRAPHYLAIRRNCDTSDNYYSLWKKLFSDITFTSETNSAGFTGSKILETIDLCSLIEEELSPDTVRKALIRLSSNHHPVLIVDEFDRISDSGTRATMADTIKMISDHAIGATIILVGVADSVDELIKEHLSIERALVQIKMPRMSNNEIKEIIDKGLKILDVSIDNDARNHIVLLSQGLPHYTHLLTLHSVRQAISSKVKKIMLEHVEKSISKSIEKAQQTTQSAYHKAIMSPRKDNIFTQVLLACSLTRTDDLGYFAASDVRHPLSKIMKKRYDVPGFSRHLNDFCEIERGPILHKIGKTRRYRFRFINPLMQPFVVMQGISSGLIDRKLLECLRGHAIKQSRS